VIARYRPERLAPEHHVRWKSGFGPCFTLFVDVE